MRKAASGAKACMGSGGRVLYVSYYAPPYGGPQGFRARQFVRHLPAHGWAPTLLTVRASAYAADPGPTDPAPDLAVRSGAIETRTLPLQGIARKVKGERAANEPSPSRPSLQARIAALLAMPDRLAGWIPFAVWKGLPGARRADVILAAGPPFTNHVVGLILAGIARKPLVVVIDDPWVSMPHRTWYGSIQRGMQASLERASVRRADRILFSTPGFLNDVCTRIPEGAGKGHVVHWGYEAEQSPLATSADPVPPVRFVYAGSLRGSQYDPRGLFAALRAMRERDPRLAARLRFDIYGRVDARYISLAEELDDIVTLHGFRSQHEVSQAIRQGHAGVLVINDSHPEFRWYLSAKLYTYAGLERPILALVPPDGDAARLIRERRLGIVAAPQDAREIAGAIERMEQDHAALATAATDVSGLSSSAVVAEVARALTLASGRRP